MRPLSVSVISLLAVMASMTTAIAQPQTAYPRAVVEQYVKSCSGGQGGQVRAVCRCIIAGIQKQYTYEKFQQLNAEITRTGKVQDPELNRIIQACRANSNTYSSSLLRRSSLNVRR
ncbi:MAG: hypothetical protein NW220_07570 [Leptolyngbyaceae cyanobacterium bins.349]|nr:hypothetical protein [Leptolyngbyaceae cyanobacterium bins.349]